MKSMKKGMKAAKSMSSRASYNKVAEGTGLKAKDVKAVVENLLELTAKEVKSNGCFKIGGALNMKLKKKKATPKRKGTNPFTGEPCIIKAKPASKTVRILPMMKMKEMIN